MRTFGCNIIATPPQERRPDKLHNAPRDGLFLGFSRTAKHALYVDDEMNQIQYMSDIAFDEAGHTSEVLSLSPYNNIHLPLWTMS